MSNQTNITTGATEASRFRRLEIYFTPDNSQMIADFAEYINGRRTATETRRISSIFDNVSEIASEWVIAGRIDRTVKA